jgi:Cell division protein CrgA
LVTTVAGKTPIVPATTRRGYAGERLRLGPQRRVCSLAYVARFAKQEAVVPKSRVRKRTVYTPPPPKTARRKVSAPWVGPAIGICLIIGLAWIVVYYLAAGSIPGLSALRAWNLVVGFAFIIAAVVLATRWH